MKLTNSSILLQRLLIFVSSSWVDIFLAQGYIAISAGSITAAIV